MTSSVAEAQVIVDEKSSVSERNAAGEVSRAPRITGSFATRLLQKALDDRKKAESSIDASGGGSSENK